MGKKLSFLGVYKALHPGEQIGKWTEEQRTLALIIIDVEEAAVLARSSTTGVNLSTSALKCVQCVQVYRSSTTVVNLSTSASLHISSPCHSLSARVRFIIVVVDAVYN